MLCIIVGYAVTNQEYSKNHIVSEKVNEMGLSEHDTSKGNQKADVDEKNVQEEANRKEVHESGAANTEEKDESGDTDMVSSHKAEIEEMSDYELGRKALWMTREEAQSYTTEELVELVVHYPKLSNIMAFEKIHDGIVALENKAVIGELASRSDCFEKLLEKYKKISCNWDLLTERDDMILSNYLAIMFLELYFGDHYNDLSPEVAKELVEEIGKKYDKMPEEYRDYQYATAFFDAIWWQNKGIIPEESIPENMKEVIKKQYENWNYKFVE